MLDNSTKDKFIELRAQGKSYDTISAELGVSKPTLIQLSKEFSDTITNLQAIELDMLKEKYHITRSARIKLFGEQIERIVQELIKRDLKDVSTERLFDLLNRYVVSLRMDGNPLEFKETVDGALTTYVPPNRENRWNG